MKLKRVNNMDSDVGFTYYQDGDKIYFSVETDVGSITLRKVGGNFWLPVDSLTLSKDIVYTMMYINGVMRIMAY